MVRNYKKVEKPYTQSTIAIAVREVQDGASIRATSAKYHLSFSLLRKHVKENENEGVTKEDMRVSSSCNFTLMQLYLSIDKSNFLK